MLDVPQEELEKQDHATFKVKTHDFPEQKYTISYY